MKCVVEKVDVVFDFFSKLNVFYYCFYDIDVVFGGDIINEYISNFLFMVDVFEEKQV